LSQMISPNLSSNNLIHNTMDAKKENRLNMYLVLIQFLSNVSAGIINSMPGFGNLLTTFTENVNKINLKAELQAANRLVFAQMKTAGKEQAVNLAINLAACIKAYASSVNNSVLESDMKFTKSQLLRKRDTSAVQNMQFILTKEIANLAALEPFGITQTEIDEVTTALDNFITNIPLPRTIATDNVMLTQEIEQLFKENDKVLEEMDKLVNIKRLTENAFFINYYLKRKVINYHGPKLALRGIITDTAGNPIPNVVISIPALNVETKSTDKGYYEFKKLPKGIQNLIFTRVNFVTTSRQVGIISGERVQLNLTLDNSTSSSDAA
jgi:hypothetical protein